MNSANPLFDKALLVMKCTPAQILESWIQVNVGFIILMNDFRSEKNGCVL